MELPMEIKDKIRLELELHFLLTHLVLESEAKRLGDLIAELDKNITIAAKVQNLLNVTKQTHTNYEAILKALQQVEQEAKEAGFVDFSPSHLEELAQTYIHDDPYYEKRILLAIKLIVSLPKGIHESVKGLAFKQISDMLGFPKDSALQELELTLIHNFKTLNTNFDAQLEDIVKVGLLTSVVTVGLMGVVALPFIAFGGAAMMTNIVTTTTLALVTGVAAAGIAYVVKDKLNQKKFIEELANLTPDELASVLAFNATVINYMLKLKVARDNEIIKARLDLYVQLNNQVNVEYYLKAHEDNVSLEKKKIINRCDKLLFKAA